MTRAAKWGIAAGAVVLGLGTAVLLTARHVSGRFEPYIREQAVRYLSERFDADVRIGRLDIRTPPLSPWRWWRTRGRGVMVTVEGRDVSLRPRSRPDMPPLMAMSGFAFRIDLGRVFDHPAVVPSVAIDGLEINVPPRTGGTRAPSGPVATNVILSEVRVNGAYLKLFPKDRAKSPLTFAIHSLRLESAGRGVPMKFDAHLTNPKPPGRIHSTGSFGPWVAGDPGASPISGDYTFSQADLGVFSGISGMLDSTGAFEGELAAIAARGEARVPDFRLKASGNPVPLRTNFEVLVDGTNGNTVLKPVRAVLGSTAFTTSGAILKHEGDVRRRIDLDVVMPRGQLRDLLRLAVKGQPMMEGLIDLRTKIGIPPLSGKVREKLVLDGRFDITGARFLKSTIQDQIDSLSRRGQGAPNAREIDEVVSRMRGTFRMEDQILTFRSLTFGVPGADVDLAGSYDIGQGAMDFRGALKLRAKVSQTMTGWKRWALKPVDPFFAKHGAGTYLPIKITGDASKPQFGLNR